MAVEDHGLEVLKKSGREVTPGNKSDLKIQVHVQSSDVDFGGEGGTSSLTKIIDKVSGSVSYFGYAQPGTATSSPLWRIIRAQKIGSVTTFGFAGGNVNFDKIWDDRASLTYS